MTRLKGRASHPQLVATVHADRAGDCWYWGTGKGESGERAMENWHGDKGLGTRVEVVGGVCVRLHDMMCAAAVTCIGTAHCGVKV